jgi:hypothetical protein
MATINNLTNGASEIEAELARLDGEIRRLKIQYDMFFNGALPHEPYEMRGRIERMIRRYTQNPPRKYAHRFHFSTLVGRYNSLAELWGRTVREKEEGRSRFATPPQRPINGERLVGECRIRDASPEEGSLRELYDRFVQARQETGDGKPPSFEGFRRGIVYQTNQLRERTGCGEIELRVVVNDRKVQLKARPGR